MPALADGRGRSIRVHRLEITGGRRNPRDHPATNCSRVTCRPAGQCTFAASPLAAAGAPTEAASAPLATADGETGACEARRMPMLACEDSTGCSRFLRGVSASFFPSAASAWSSGGACFSRLTRIRASSHGSMPHCGPAPSALAPCTHNTLAARELTGHLPQV